MSECEFVYGDPAVYRRCDPTQVGTDGYPAIWHTVKHQVREQAGHRCVRCGHPYRRGEHGTGEWSPCDRHCTHAGPIRARSLNAGWIEYDGEDAGPLLALSSVEKEARWRILTVHHANGIKADLRWWNLLALCQRCHLEIQGRVVMEQLYPYEHSDWFKPYAAGYYASTYLGEELSREQTMARLDELLALERVA